MTPSGDSYSPTVQLGPGDWASVTYALAHFATCQSEERHLPHDRAQYLLRRIDEQVNRQLIEQGQLPTLRSTRFELSGLDRSPDGG